MHLKTGISSTSVKPVVPKGKVLAALQYMILSNKINRYKF